jgi:hypothetical protein
MAQEVGIGLGLDGETGKVLLNQACKNQHEKPSLGESPTKNMEERKIKSNEKKTKESKKEPKRTKNSSRRR